ncbi:Tn3 family transposase [Streptomyces sp. NPDC002187]|uniref:Tn3 family transposase n=1 Tax=Streptomyces sp. NPDC002187 TaxID=3364637 RepID=UPI00367E64A1
MGHLAPPGRRRRWRRVLPCRHGSPIIADGLRNLCEYGRGRCPSRRLLPTPHLGRKIAPRSSVARLTRSVNGCTDASAEVAELAEGDGEFVAEPFGLVLNAVVRWNTRYLVAAVARLRSVGRGTGDGGVARLSPLEDRHINFLGRCLFTIKAADPVRACVPSGARRVSRASGIDGGAPGPLGDSLHPVRGRVSDGAGPR